MRNDDILFIVNAYYKLKGKETPSLPASVAWKRRLNLKELVKASETINEALEEIKQKYSDDAHSEPKANDDNKNARIVKSEFITDFVNEQKEVLTQDTDVTIRKIKIGELDGLNLSDEMLDTLEFMIEE